MPKKTKAKKTALCPHKKWIKREVSDELIIEHCAKCGAYRGRHKDSVIYA